MVFARSDTAPNENTGKLWQMTSTELQDRGGKTRSQSRRNSQPPQHFPLTKKKLRRGQMLQVCTYINVNKGCLRVHCWTMRMWRIFLPRRRGESRFILGASGWYHESSGYITLLFAVTVDCYITSRRRYHTTWHVARGRKISTIGRSDNTTTPRGQRLNHPDTSIGYLSWFHE